MSGTDALIQRIIDDTEQKCTEIIAQAEGEAQSILLASEQDIAKRQELIDAKCDQNAKEITRRRMSLANLELKKKQLLVRQNLVERAYARAGEVLFADDERYLGLIGRLIDKYAVDGESVIICQEDKQRITAKFLHQTGKKLSLSEHYGDFLGGIKLRTEQYEKNLTLPLLLRQCRETTEGEVVKTLYGEQ